MYILGRLCSAQGVVENEAAKENEIRFFSQTIFRVKEGTKSVRASCFLKRKMGV